MSDSLPFLEGCVQGDYLVEEVDDFVDAWHRLQPDTSLPDYLGFTTEEYGAWVVDPDVLQLIVYARLKNRPLEDVIGEMNSPTALAMAARSDKPEEVDRVLMWLKKRNYA